MRAYLTQTEMCYMEFKEVLNSYVSIFKLTCITYDEYHAKYSNTVHMYTHI